MSNITRSDVVDYLKNLSSDEELLSILKEVHPYDIDTDEEGILIWNSGIHEDDLSDSEDGSEDGNGPNDIELPDWLNKNKPHHVKFYCDMVNAGYEDNLRHYQGRFFYDGPGLDVGRFEMDEAIRATKVKLQKDSMGLDYIIYPEN